MVNKLKRKLVQIFVTITTNSYLKGFTSGTIYKGNLKRVCVPGLNCYSCPGALGACPIGSLQTILADIKFRFPYYVVGFLIFIGTMFGRLVCGWLCPFGLFQELIYKIPSPKIKISKKFQMLKYLKYIILIMFVIILPLFWVNDLGNGKPTFCKYICPAGTLEGGIPLVFLNNTLSFSLGFLYKWKLTLLIINIILSIIIFRPFCRFICPLGAIYSVFNPISLYKLEIDKDKCIKCRKCERECKLNIKTYENPNSLECIRCGECINICPTNAIKSSFQLKDNKNIIKNNN